MPTVSSHDATIYYEVSGTGPGLVFAHGAGGNRISWWQQVPHFSERYRVVTFDHRCFGRSRCSADTFHPRHFADDLVAILDAVGIAKAALVCQSMGGWTGLGCALQYPERVSCLVLGGTPAGIFAEPVLRAAAKIGSSAASEGIQGNLALAPDFPERRPELALLYDHISGLNTAFTPAMLARMFDEEGRVMPERLAGYDRPTLMLLGECDQLFPPDVLRHVATLIPGAEVRDFPGIGHSTYFEAPERFNTVVGEFLAKHHPPEPGALR